MESHSLGDDGNPDNYTFYAYEVKNIKSGDSIQMYVDVGTGGATAYVIY